MQNHLKQQKSFYLTNYAVQTLSLSCIQFSLVASVMATGMEIWDDALFWVHHLRYAYIQAPAGMATEVITVVSAGLIPTLNFPFVNGSAQTLLTHKKICF